MTSRDSTETERKYDPGPTARVPAFADIAGVGLAGEPSETLLEAVYYDTAGLELATRGIRLRRRSAGTDQGWHLKLPAGPGPLAGNPGAPRPARPYSAEFLDHLAVFTRGQKLPPVARISTLRGTEKAHGLPGILKRRY